MVLTEIIEWLRESRMGSLILKVIEITASIVTLLLGIAPLSNLLGLPDFSWPIRILFLIIFIFIVSFMVLSKILTPKIPIYPERSHYMDYELIEFMKKAHDIKILNIAFTWMKRPNSKQITINKIKEDNAIFEILIVKRKRRKEDFSYLLLRQDDEENYELIINMNIVLFELFIFMLESLYSINQDGCEKGKRCHYNIKVIEYPFIPVMTMYIFDDTDLIFGPYISTNCNSIPMFHLKKSKFQIEISRAYDQLWLHYSILSARIPRNDKEIISSFCYFDGSRNKSIHTFIDENSEALRRYLFPTDPTKPIDIKIRYEQYLRDENDTYCNDIFFDNLGDNKLEGKFDAVMRHIENHIRPTPINPLNSSHNKSNSKKKKIK
ncbi:MAG: hypothetical protein WA144_05840 [Candidatus Methanoperedens sp.]